VRPRAIDLDGVHCSAVGSLLLDMTLLGGAEVVAALVPSRLEVDLVRHAK
jgi:hypothetical protein